MVLLDPLDPGMGTMMSISGSSIRRLWLRRTSAIRTRIRIRILIPKCRWVE
jgi:hypothetical protein